MISTIIATVLLTTAPTVKFTSDSTYKKDGILDFSVTEKVVVETDDATGETVSEQRFYTLNVKENYVLGYDVYDDKATDHVDGVKVNGAFLPGDWKVEGFDPSAECVVTVKTVYSDDIAGWLAMARSGDFSALMSNPVTVFQFVYYVLAALSLILGGVGLVKAKKAKVKSADQIAEKVSSASDALQEKFDEKVQELENDAIDMVSAVMEGTLGVIKRQNDVLIQATVLARSGDEQSTLALLDLLKNAGSESVEQITQDVKARILEAKQIAEAKKAEAVKSMKEAVAEISAPADADPKGGYDGTSI